VSHEGNRGLVANGAMRPVFVLVAAPILQLFARVGKRQEPVGVQTLGLQRAIERFDERVDTPMSVKGWSRPLWFGLALGRDIRRSHGRRSV
jgi:hypothetical protein